MVALTDLQRVRLKISDAPRWVDATTFGDGTAVTFGLDGHINITSGSAFVPAAGGNSWVNTAATFNQSGYLTFANVVSANSAFRRTYTWSVFSDDEVTDFLAVGGNVIGAAIEAVGSLMFDAMRCARWNASDGAGYDDTQSQAHARALYDKLVEEAQRDGIAGGGMQSWAVNQGDW